MLAPGSRKRLSEVINIISEGVLVSSKFTNVIEEWTDISLTLCQFQHALINCSFNTDRT
jgi:hypothetical protein